MNTISIKYGEYSIEDQFSSMLDDNNRFVIQKLSYNKYAYERYEGKESKGKKIIASDDILKIGVFPITPQNIPNKYANHMLISLSTPLVINARTSVECYLIMPIEVGIVTNNVIIDVYSLGYTKYALYGIPERGIICRYYKSEAYADIPKLEPFKEAAVRCIFKNYTDYAKIISKIVYPIDGADLYYNNTDAYFDMLEIIFESKLNVDVINIKVREIGWNAKKTNLGKPFNDSYIMEWGY